MMMKKHRIALSNCYKEVKQICYHTARYNVLSNINEGTESLLVICRRGWTLMLKQMFKEYFVRLWVLCTYLLAPRCRVLLEQLTGLQLVKKFPAFHGTRRFITALTSVRHLSLSWISPIQSIYPHNTSCRSTLILSSHLRLGLPSVLFPSCFPHQDPIRLPSPHPYAPHAI